MTSASAPPAACPNCDASLELDPVPDHCPRCGQQTRLHAPTLWEFLHEFIGHYVALEGALWRTLYALALRPGVLTQEYLAGRRRRYVLPLRVYLSISFVFFVAVRLLSGDHRTTVELQMPPPDAPAAVATEPAASGADGLAQRFGTRLAERAATLSARQGELQAQVLAKAPWAMFLLLPLYAGLVQAAYRARRLAYGAHFVHSLHMHSFWFLALLALALLPDAVTFPVLAAMFLHGLLAQRRVYGGRWGPTLLRGMLVTAIYGAVVVATAALLVFATLLAS